MRPYLYYAYRYVFGKCHSGGSSASLLSSGSGSFGSSLGLGSGNSLGSSGSSARSLFSSGWK